MTRTLITVTVVAATACWSKSLILNEQFFGEWIFTLNTTLPNVILELLRWWSVNQEKFDCTAISNSLNYQTGDLMLDHWLWFCCLTPDQSQWNKLRIKRSSWLEITGSKDFCPTYVESGEADIKMMQVTLNKNVFLLSFTYYSHATVAMLGHCLEVD